MKKSSRGVDVTSIRARFAMFSLSIVVGFAAATLVQTAPAQARIIMHTETPGHNDIKPNDTNGKQNGLPIQHVSLPREIINHTHSEPFAASDTNSQTVPKTTAPPEPVDPVATIIPDVVTPIPSNGMVPVFYKIETEKPVVFLTIDDGMVKDPEAIAYMHKHHVVASLFLNNSKISDNYAYFKTLIEAGNTVENHTVNHLDLTKLSYAQQKKEICDNADRFADVFGKRPTLLRTPYGAFNNITRRAAADCGMTALIHWHAKANGGSMQYQRGDKLQAGDIVLMHFRKEIIADLTAFTEATQKSNLQVVMLEDWIH